MGGDTDRKQVTPKPGDGAMRKCAGNSVLSGPCELGLTGTACEGG